MPTQNTQPIKEKILYTLRIRGPSLPMQISGEINQSGLFTSAFLSELLADKQIKMSNMRVGSSAIHYLAGQEAQLEKYSQYLKPKEREAYELLKSKRFLKDKNLEPAIRVALREIKDFAYPFQIDEEIFWRYFIEPIENFSKPIQPKIQETKQEEKPIEQKKEEIIYQEPKKEIVEEKKVLEIFDKKPEIEFRNPLVIKEEPKTKKEKPKSEFVLKIIEFLDKKGFEIVEEKEHKAKEFLCVIKINTSLGLMNFLTIAKDKKTLSDSDLKKHLSDAQSIPLPALVIYTENLSKKAIEFKEQYNSVIKTLKFDQ
jgi:hypothetical protein